MSDLTHFNAAGEAHMVDVGNKQISHRIAVAEGAIRMQAATLRLIVEGGHKKGDVLGIARVAGIMAAKKTADLIPLCHPLSLTRVELELEGLMAFRRAETLNTAFPGDETLNTPNDESPAVYCRATVETRGRTGVEMEALTAVQIALLTVYDMCKAVDRGMTMEGIRLLQKAGGKSGNWDREHD